MAAAKSKHARDVQALRLAQMRKSIVEATAFFDDLHLLTLPMSPTPSLHSQARYKSLHSQASHKSLQSQSSIELNTDGGDHLELRNSFITDTVDAMGTVMGMGTGSGYQGTRSGTGAQHRSTTTLHHSTTTLHHSTTFLRPTLPTVTPLLIAAALPVPPTDHANISRANNTYDPVHSCHSYHACHSNVTLPRTGAGVCCATTGRAVGKRL